MKILLLDMDNKNWGSTVLEDASELAALGLDLFPPSVPEDILVDQQPASNVGSTVLEDAPELTTRGMDLFPPSIPEDILDDQQPTSNVDSIVLEDAPELATPGLVPFPPSVPEDILGNQQPNPNVDSVIDAELLEANSDVGKPNAYDEASSSSSPASATVLHVDQEIQTDSPCVKNASAQTSFSAPVYRMEQETQTVSSFVEHRSSQTSYTLSDLTKLQKAISEHKETVKDNEGTITDLERQQIKEPFESFEDLLKNDPEASTFYTGFQHCQLVGMYKFFMDGVSPSEIKYWGDKKFSHPEKKLLTPMQEFVMTLVRLRSGLLVEDIAYRFGISVGTVSQTVTTWILIMHQKFECIQLLMFASREKVKETLPQRFKNFKNLRIIIDGAEIFCQTPADFSQQSNTYSQYKAHNTFKLLLGCTPTGAVSFVSELFEGSISDRQLVIKSGLIDMLQERDLVLADRGFTVKDITDKKNIDLRIPAFMYGRDQLSPQEEMSSREIAKCRIFVEHGVRRLKEFRIFQKMLPLNIRHIASQMVKVCAFLTNFQQPLDI